MAKIVEVKLGEYRGVSFFDTAEHACQRNDVAILETDQGVEFGRILSDTEKVCEGQKEAVAGKIQRLANEPDMKIIEENRKKSSEAMAACLRKVQDHKMDMQIVECEYSFDQAKVIFYFTAEGRVDFRELVKDLARIFKVRIELKQIGVRDKAKIVGGFGVCGRTLCCSSYMKAFHPLSIKMSKEQGLPLNPTRISGVCGRIKCCMAYEFQVYRELARDLPKMGEKITTPQGKGKVTDVNILKRYVSVELGEGQVTKVLFAVKEGD